MKKIALALAMLAAAAPVAAQTAPLPQQVRYYCILGGAICIPLLPTR